MMLEVDYTQVDHNTWTLVKLKPRKQRTSCLNLTNRLRRIESDENGKYAYVIISSVTNGSSCTKVYFEKSKDAFTFKLMNLDMCGG